MGREPVVPRNGLLERLVGAAALADGPRAQRNRCPMVGVTMGCHRLRLEADRLLMEHAPPPIDHSAHAFTAPVRGIAVASVALGFFSMIVFWWKPFGGMLAAVGLILG